VPKFDLFAFRRSGNEARFEASQGGAVNFTLIQGLRGLAALWVVLFHLDRGNVITALTARLPPWLSYAIFGYGSAGVAVFFVLSGFVIAHSLERRNMTTAELARFAIRRSIRLDPPYWGSMALIVAIATAIALRHHEPAHLPDEKQILAHITYTQELLGVPELQVVYWTLTYEIQFYLVYATSMLLKRPLSWALYGLALFSALEGHEWASHGLFVNLWHGFYLGVLAYRTGYLSERPWPLLLLVAVTLIAQRPEAGIFGVPCAVSAVLLFTAARFGKLTTALSSALWQGLGAISYSLYLVHVPTLRLLTGAWQRGAGRGFFADTAAAFVLAASCIAAAALFHLALERPSHRVAKRLFRGPRGSVLKDSKEASLR
jgi:peptidoglycan/LPS O-acetylase OafA/YrhL